MNSLEKKALKQIETILNDINTHQIYEAVSNALESNGVTNEESRLRILKDCSNNSLDAVKTPLKEAKEWLAILLEETNEKS